VSTSEQGFPRSGAKVSGDVTGNKPESTPFDPPARNGSSNGSPSNRVSADGARPPAPGSLSSQMSNPLPPAPHPAGGQSTQQMPPVGRPYAPGGPAGGGSPFSSAPVPVGQPPSSVVPPGAQRAVPPQAQTTAQPPATQQAGQQGRPAPVQRAAGPRKVRLNVAKVDPFSVLKLSFLVSVGIGVATVVAAIVVWQVLNGMGVFSDINRLATQIAGKQSTFDVNDYVGLGKVVSLATVIAVINVALLTALSTLGAFLYNLSSGLVGGLHVTLSDD
jgi:hypothetical protein